MDILLLLDEIEDIIEDGTSVPFSKKILVDTEELLDILKEIRIRLPDEIKQAAWIKEEKQRILAEAQKDADNILNEAEYKLEELIDQEGITKAAQERAEEIINKAQTTAKEIRLGAMEYADSLLAETQEQLKELIETINENRRELRGIS
ncbi:MAG: ATPase [Tissierellaceae bacterium]|jgi:vacuolar-type H+-ATPase subunit H|nr:ATPase [Tissierellia bacterium]